MFLIHQPFQIRENGIISILVHTHTVYPVHYNAKMIIFTKASIYKEAVVNAFCQHMCISVKANPN